MKINTELIDIRSVFNIIVSDIITISIFYSEIIYYKNTRKPLFDN